MGLGLLLVVDPTGSIPQVYGPIPTHQHRAQDAEPSVDPSQCPRIKEDVALTPSWSGETLTLTGPPTWSALKRHADGGLLIYPEPAQVPSGAGSYRLVPGR